MPFRRLSNAIICDLRRRMSSIRRSSLISITLGLLTVIGAIFRSLPLRRRQDNASNAHLSLAFAHVGMARAGPYRCWGLPASAATEPLWGCGGASVSTAPVVCDASGLGSCDSRHRLLFSGHLFFRRL